MHVKLTNGNVDTYPYNVGQLRRDNPNTSFPKQIPDITLAEYGVYKVSITATPSYDDRTQMLSQNNQPHKEGDQWVVGWTVTDKTAEEIQQYDYNAAEANRSQRDRLLAETDWVVIKAQETGVAVDAAWATYRQALRDITTHANWPHLTEADWPVKP